MPQPSRCLLRVCLARNRLDHLAECLFGGFITELEASSADHQLGDLNEFVDRIVKKGELPRQ